MGSSLSKDEKKSGSAIEFPGGGKVKAHSKTKKLVFADGVFAEVIKDKSSGAKKFVKEIPEGVAQVLHAGRATDVYIDMRDEIVQNCEVQVEVLKELFDKVDHWDARKINEIVNNYKPEFKKHGVQVHFNQHSLWMGWYNAPAKCECYYPKHVRWITFADAEIDAKLCTQYAYDPLKIYDPPGPAPTWGIASCYNKENMKLVKAGATHFPSEAAAAAAAGTTSAKAPLLPEASASST